MRSLRELFELGAARGDETFLVYGDRTVSYGASWRAAVRRRSSCRRELPLGRGDRVAVAAANCPEWCQTFWSAVPSGAVLVGLNGWWKGDELLYGLRIPEPRSLVADRARYGRIAGLLGGCPDLRVVYLIDAEPATLPVARRDRSSCDMRGSCSSVRPPSPRSPRCTNPVGDEIDEDDAAVMFYTSGTTGRPKGAISSHRGMIANLQNTFYRAGRQRPAGGGDRVGAIRCYRPGGSAQRSSLLTSPLFHVSGCHSNMVVCFAAGLRLVIPPGRFDPEVVMATIERERIAIWSAVPTMVWRVVEHPRRHEFDLSSVVSIAYGGSPSAGELQRMVRETFPSVRSIGNAYGLTETSSVATINSGAEALERPDSVGQPLPVVEIKVVPPECATRRYRGRRRLGRQ